MAKTELHGNKKIKVEDESSSLTGTLASVFLLGGFIIVLWVSVWMLYVNRF